MFILVFLTQIGDLLKSFYADLQIGEYFKKELGTSTMGDIA